MKKVIKYIIACLLVCLIANTGKAQNTNTLYFMDNIAERNNINPAFTPNCNFYLDFIFLPNMYMNFGNNNFIFNDFLYNQNGQTSLFLNSQQNIDNFYNSLNPSTEIKFNFGLNILSFGFKVKKHYFTFDMGVNAEAYAYIPRDIFKLALYGAQDPHNINKFDFSTLGVDATLYSKVGLGYMYQINNKWQIGVKAKFLMGYANINTQINKMELGISRQSWTLETDGAIKASLPLHFNTNEDGSLDVSSLSMLGTNELISLLYKPAGMGGAIDLGFTYSPIKNLTISASITDLGLIYWKRNTLSGSMKGSHEITELIDYTVGDSLNTEEITDMFTQLGEDIVGSIKTDGTEHAYSTMLHANFYTGIEYGILKNRISFGAVNRLTFNNKRLTDEVTLALNLRPLNWLKATVDYSFINGRWGNLGLGLNLRAGIFNMYILADYIPISFARLNLGDVMETGKDLKIPIPNKSQCFNLQIGWTWNIGNYSTDPDRDGVKGRRDHCPNTDIDFLRSKCPDIKKRKHFVDKHGCDLDDDKDGIHNCYDQCPETPLGVEVDSVGCPFDTDKDGIYDYQDHCPDTPEGVEVTAMGCPTDADNDGVADYLDQCPETPANVLVDSIGCPVDNDKDGIADYIDLCPDTPENVTVDANGCPIDSDEDGIADYLDLCPETPLGVTVNENGCPTDTDKDGVADYLDKCPDTPEGTIVNEMGCPLDTDGDGILDSEDKCPQQPGPASNYGCPELKKEVRNLFKKAMKGIQFETGKDIIKKSSYPILDQIVSVMELNPEYHLTISGHTDNVGDDDENMQLSIDRAAAVGKYIINKGINADRITTQGFGETKPIASNKTSKRRTENRRVEFEISFEEITYEKIINPELQDLIQPTDSINNTQANDSIK